MRVQDPNPVGATPVAMPCPSDSNGFVAGAAGAASFCRDQAAREKFAASAAPASGPASRVTPQPAAPVNWGGGRSVRETPRKPRRNRVIRRLRAFRCSVAEPADKPGPVLDSHSSRRSVTATLKQPTRTRRGPRHEVPIWPCSRWGLPCRPVTRLAVRSYRTISPLPRALAGRSAVSFCCTFRRLAPPRRYLAPCPVEPGLSSAFFRMTRLSGRLRRGGLSHAARPDTGRDRPALGPRRAAALFPHGVTWCCATRPTTEARRAAWPIKSRHAGPDR